MWLMISEDRTVCVLPKGGSSSQNEWPQGQKIVAFQRNGHSGACGSFSWTAAGMFPVGRDRTCRIVLDRDMYVSRLHCTVYIEGAEERTEEPSFGG